MREEKRNPVITAYLRDNMGNNCKLELPLGESELLGKLIDTYISLDDRSSYRYNQIEVGERYTEACTSDILSILEKTATLREINEFAGVIADFDETQMYNFVEIVNAARCDDIARLNGIANNIDRFDIHSEITDTAELGSWFVDQEHPNLDGILYDHLDFDGIGCDLIQDRQGVLTDDVYIHNFDTTLSEIYCEIESGQTYDNAVPQETETVKRITADEVRDMTDSEGLILQGCGGDLREWVDGINDALTEAGILRNGAKFRDISVFKHDGVTNLLFNMENVDLDVGKLALWRIQSHETFGGTWLSDYLPNKLGVNLEQGNEMRMGGM
jgi:hypothetical protein